MSYSLGIDLGTTFTAAATVVNGRAEIAPLGHGGLTLPSVIYVREDHTTLAGHGSVRRAATDPDGLARDFKRRMGDPVPLLLRGSPYAPEQLTGSLLKWVVDTVSADQGGAPEHVALSHPANWTEFQRSLLRGAVQIAGLSDVAMITEPEAAAIAYATLRDVAPGASIAVYDLGGGTFDAAVLRRNDDGGFQLIGDPQGIDRLGGIDFDLAVLGWVERQLSSEWDNIDRNDPTFASAIHNLRNECVAAKEDLSTDTETVVTVLLPGLQRDLRLTRAEFEGMIEPQLRLTIEALQRTIVSAGLSDEDLDAVLLVGGSSRIPLVGEMVENAVERPTVTDAHPKFAIALGTALHAASETGGRSRVPGDPAVRELSVPSDSRSSGDSTPTPDATSEARPPASPSTGRPSGALIGGLVAVLLVVVIGAVALLGGGDGDENEDGATGVAPTTTADVTPPALDTAPPPTEAPVTTAAEQPVDTDQSLADVARGLVGTSVDRGDPAGLFTAALGGAGLSEPTDPRDLYLSLQSDRTLVPVDLAATTAGALLFGFEVEPPLLPSDRADEWRYGISLGDGSAVVAASDATEVVIGDVDDFRFAGVPSSIVASDGIEIPSAFLLIQQSIGIGSTVLGVGVTDTTLFIPNGTDPGAVRLLDRTTLVDSGSVVVDEAGGALADLSVDGTDAWVSAPGVPAIARITGDGESTVFASPSGTGAIDGLDGVVFATGPNGFVRVDPDAEPPAVLVETGIGVADTRAGFGSVWTSSGNQIVRADPETGEVLAQIPTDGNAFGLNTTDELMWVSVRDTDELVAIDPETNEIIARVDVGRDPVGVGTSAGSALVWVSEFEGSVSVVDESSREVVAQLVVGAGADPVAVDDDVAWVVSTAAMELSKIRLVRQ